MSKTVEEAEAVLEDVRSWPITWPRKRYYMLLASEILKEVRAKTKQEKEFP